ncbi:hypothetical protein KRX57_04680 [Weeksellaceae bacterium TAE3-ERU29]|nr:hypothetical protein [Weeksellaceae bacterium TAE3-ERU29]
MKNSILLAFLLFSTSVFSQKRYFHPVFPKESSRYRIYYKTDEKTKIKAYIRMFMVEDENQECEMVTLFLKRDNPWLTKDFKTISYCLGYQTTEITGIGTFSNDKYLHVEISYFGPKGNIYRFIFEQDNQGKYILIKQQEGYSSIFEDRKIKWYNGRM